MSVQKALGLGVNRQLVSQSSKAELPILEFRNFKYMQKNDLPIKSSRGSVPKTDGIAEAGANVLVPYVDSDTNPFVGWIFCGVRVVLVNYAGGCYIKPYVNI